MDFAPDDDHVAIADAVDAACADFDDEYWTRCDTEHRFPTEFYDRMAAGGWVGISMGSIRVMSPSHASRRAFRRRRRDRRSIPRSPGDW